MTFRNAANKPCSQSPGLLNSVAGFITTIVNIYTARSGFWSVSAIITASVTGGCTIFMIGCFLIYDTWLLTTIKKEHKLRVQQMEDENKREIVQ